MTQFGGFGGMGLPAGQLAGTPLGKVDVVAGAVVVTTGLTVVGGVVATVVAGAGTVTWVVTGAGRTVVTGVAVVGVAAVGRVTVGHVICGAAVVAALVTREGEVCDVAVGAA